jgi:pyruvate formate-lyase activating enzyme-like uncharacterized protein
MKDIKKMEKLIDASTTLTEAKKQEIRAHLEQQKSVKEENRPDGDVYYKKAGKDPETGVEIPSEGSVEEAKKWVDEENRR